jgi:hypothetical protein
VKNRRSSSSWGDYGFAFINLTVPIIEMRRKKPDEKSERLRSDRIFEELKHLRQRAMRWAKDNLSSLIEWESQVPASLNDRAQDSWRPLLAIAERTGKRWAEYGRESAVKLAGENSGTRPVNPSSANKPPK